MIKRTLKNKLLKFDLNSSNENENNKKFLSNDRPNNNSKEIYRLNVDIIKKISIKRSDEESNNFITNTIKANVDEDNCLISHLDEINLLSLTNNKLLSNRINDLELLLSPLEVNNYVKLSEENRVNNDLKDIDAMEENHNYIFNQKIYNPNVSKSYPNRKLNILLSPLETGLLMNFDDFIPILINNHTIDKSMLELLLSPLETYYPLGFLNLRVSKMLTTKKSDKVENFTNKIHPNYLCFKQLPIKFDASSYSECSLSSNNVIHCSNIIHCCYCCYRCCSLRHNDINKSTASLINNSDLSLFEQSENYKGNKLKYEDI